MCASGRLLTAIASFSASCCVGTRANKICPRRGGCMNGRRRAAWGHNRKMDRPAAPMPTASGYGFRRIAFIVRIFLELFERVTHGTYLALVGRWPLGPLGHSVSRRRADSPDHGRINMKIFTIGGVSVDLDRVYGVYRVVASNEFYVHFGGCILPLVSLQSSEQLRPSGCSLHLTPRPSRQMSKTGCFDSCLCSLNNTAEYTFCQALCVFD